jgi:hypothetical protein
MWMAGSGPPSDALLAAESRRPGGLARRFAAIMAKIAARPKARDENVKSRGGAIGADCRRESGVSN